MQVRGVAGCCAEGPGWKGLLPAPPAPCALLLGNKDPYKDWEFEVLELYIWLISSPLHLHQKKQTCLPVMTCSHVQRSFPWNLLEHQPVLPAGGKGLEPACDSLRSRGRLGLAT